MRWSHLAFSIVAVSSLTTTLANASSDSDSLINSLMVIEQQARALDIVGQIPISSNRQPASSAITIELANDKIRASRNLETAVSHLVLGDAARALQLAKNAYQQTNERDASEANALLKVIFESERRLGLLQEAATTCSQLIARGQQSHDLVLSCAHTLAQFAKVRSPTKPTLTKETLAAFAYSSSVRALENVSLQPSILISQALSFVDANKDAQEYLSRAVNNSRESTPWRARAQLTLAVHAWKNGDKDKCQSMLFEILTGKTSDEVTKLYAHNTMSRLYASKGMLDAAEVHQKQAISISEKLPEETPQSEIGAGRVQSSTPWNVPRAFSATERAELRSEFASLLCAVGKYKDCASEHERNQNSLPSGKQIEILVRSEALSSKSISQASRLLGFTKADVAWIEKQRHLPVPLSLTDLRERSYTLLRLAKTYGSNNSDNLKRLASIYSSATYAREEISKSQSSANTVLNVLINGKERPTDALLDLTTKRLETLTLELSKTLILLELKSFEHWNSNEASFSAAKEHRLSLLSRIEALYDGLSKEKTLAEKGKLYEKRDLLKNSTRTIISENFRLQAQLAALHFLSSISQSEKALAQVPATSRSVNAMQKTANSDVFLAELQLLNSESFVALTQTLEVLNRTATELSDIHSKMFRIPENSPEHTSLNSTKIAWSRVFSSIHSLQTTLEAAKLRTQQYRELFASEIEQVVAKSTSAEATLNLLSESLRTEMQNSLSIAANTVIDDAKNIHNKIRLAIASSDLRVVAESEEEKRRLNKATNERKRWIDSLRTSLKWELAR